MGTTRRELLKWAARGAAALLLPKVPQVGARAGPGPLHPTVLALIEATPDDFWVPRPGPAPFVWTVEHCIDLARMNGADVEACWPAGTVTVYRHPAPGHPVAA